MPEVLTEVFHSGGFLVSEARGKRSREVGVITAQDLLAGTVLGRRYTGGTPIGTPTANAGNTGNGAFGAVTLTGAAKPGTYRVTFVEPATNLGTFIVEDPDGKYAGRGNVGTAFSGGGLSFTISDGATDFVAGDGFAVVVSGGSYKYVAFDPTASTGEQTAVAILYGGGNARDTVYASAADKSATIIVRQCEINKNELVWGANVTTQVQKDDALAALAASAGIISR